MSPPIPSELVLPLSGYLASRGHVSLAMVARWSAHSPGIRPMPHWAAAVKTLGWVGLVAYGVVQLLVAYLAVRVATGGGAKADKAGALQTIAEQPAAGSCSGCSPPGWSP